MYNKVMVNMMKGTNLVICMDNRKRVMVTLSYLMLSKLDEIVNKTGETYSEFLNRMIVEQSSTERKID